MTRQTRRKILFRAAELLERKSYTFSCTAIYAAKNGQQDLLPVRGNLKLVVKYEDFYGFKSEYWPGLSRVPSESTESDYSQRILMILFFEHCYDDILGDDE